MKTAEELTGYEDGQNPLFELIRRREVQIVNIEGEWTEYLVAPESAYKLIFENGEEFSDGKYNDYVSDAAEQFDDSVCFFVTDAEFENLTDDELSEYVQIEAYNGENPEIAKWRSPYVCQESNEVFEKGDDMDWEDISELEADHYAEMLNEGIEHSECSVCEGELAPLGQLGNRVHYRCRNCGMDSSVEVGRNA